MAYTGMCRWKGYGFRPLCTKHGQVPKYQPPPPPHPFPGCVVAPAHPPQPREITTLATMSIYLYQTLY